MIWDKMILVIMGMSEMNDDRRLSFYKRCTLFKYLIYTYFLEKGIGFIAFPAFARLKTR